MLSGTHGCKQVRYSIPETSPHKTLHQRMGKARRSQEVVCMSVCLYVCAFHECLTVFFVCMSSCLHTRVCIMYVSCAFGGQKRSSGTLEMELRMIVSHHMGAGNQT